MGSLGKHWKNDKTLKSEYILLENKGRKEIREWEMDREVLNEALKSREEVMWCDQI